MRRIAVTVTVSIGSIAVLLGAQAAYATYPGRNGRIAYAQDRGNGAEIYTMRPNGADRVRLTDGDRSAWFPSWSPDGTRIVYELQIAGDDCGGSVELVNADGSGMTDLTSVSPRFADACAQGPSFTPDGRRIVFVAGSFTTPDAVWSFDLEGRHVRRIVVDRQLARFAPRDRILKSPRVSPDGRTLCFEVVHLLPDGLNEKGLFTVRMNGTHLRQIVPFSYDVSIKGGDWAPGGNRIVFSDHAGPMPSDQAQNIFTVRPDGTGLRQLTYFRKLPPDVGTAAGSFSPDGQWIIIKHVNDDRSTLWKVRPDGTDLMRIARLRFYPTGATEWGPQPSS